MRKMRVLTWHVHGSYLWYLAHARHDFYVPVKPGRPEGYGGRAGTLPWPENVHEVEADAARRLELDCVLFQSRNNYLVDQYELLSDAQQRLPRIYLEHDPPRQHPTDTQHVVDDPHVLLVHVTPFNALMWDSGRTPTRVIEHGVTVPAGARYSGELPRGVVVVNGLRQRGRRLGADLFDRVRRDVALDIAGMGSEALGGAGDLSRDRLAAFITQRRFFFNPIRYTSLGLAVCEAMMLGMPVIGLATTEMATVIENGVSGYVDTDARRLIAVMQDLLRDPAEARRLGEGARRLAEQRFNIRRFAGDWDDAFALVTGARRELAPASTGRGNGAGVW
ncbi:MAG: glycosyltransferase family 4 protein [Dehalococcoidia bacterium]|nr:glycosyltransferase family 4 protein [Dehalococcoidia bacterium]